MPVLAERLEFAPPPTPGKLRALGLAVLAHVLLLVALTWGIHWQHDSGEVSVQAELWSATPEEAAPPAPQTAPPEPVQPPRPQPKPEPKPEPKVDPAELQRQADIALAKEKEKKKKREAERAAAQAREIAREKEAKAEREREAAAKAKTREKAQAEQAKREADKKKQQQAEAQQRAQKDAQDKRKEQQEAEARRQAQIKRAAELAGSGDEQSSGKAAKASGGATLSSAYQGRIRARIKPNITFTQEITSNLQAEVEVRCAPDGTITSRRITKSSGNKAWDEAVLGALDKTEVLPRNEDGRVPSPMTLVFRPKDLGQ